MMDLSVAVGAAVYHAKRWQERAADGNFVDILKMRCRRQKIKPQAVKLSDCKIKYF
jgi:hypothetical protein